MALYLSLYIAISFIQALFLARGINKTSRVEFPKTTVAFFTLVGPVATLVFLLGLAAGAIERFVQGK